MSKLKEQQLLCEAPSACAVFASFMAPDALCEVGCYLFCSDFQEPHKMGGKPLGISRHRASGNMGVTGCVWLSPWNTALLLLPRPYPAPTREPPSCIREQGKRTRTCTGPPPPLGKQWNTCSNEVAFSKPRVTFKRPPWHQLEKWLWQLPSKDGRLPASPTSATLAIATASSSVSNLPKSRWVISKIPKGRVRKTSWFPPDLFPK